MVYYQYDNLNRTKPRIYFNTETYIIRCDSVIILAVLILLFYPIQRMISFS